MEPQQIQPQNDIQKMVSTDSASGQFNVIWLVWASIFLFLVLATFYLWLLPLFPKSIVLSVKKQGADMLIHGVKMIAPVDGFLVIRRDENGLPGPVVASTRYLIRDAYKDFDLTLAIDQTATPGFGTQNSITDKFYAYFYKDLNNNRMYDDLIDVEIASDLLGRKLKLIIEN